MNSRIKRIIAREGLIVISLMLLAGVSYGLDLLLINHIKSYEANVQEIQPVSHLPNDPQNILTNAGKILRFPKNAKDDVIKQTIRSEFPYIKEVSYFVFDTPQGQNIGASYNDKGQRVFDNIVYKISFSYIAIFFLIFAYPLYLLGRFVVWAIVTLKGKVESGAIS